MPLSLGFVLGDDDEPERGLGDLSGGETLAAAGDNDRDSHRVDVRGLEIDLHFAALHSEDPHDERLGGNRLVQLGGDGTPMVQDLPLCELAVARAVSDQAARNRTSDSLDLKFRLSGYWGGLRSGRGHVWVGRRIARMSRHLDREQVRIVDAAVSAAIDESPGRVLTIAEAAIIRADPDAARRKDEERRRRRCVVIGRSDEDGLRAVFARIAAGDAAWVDAMVERIADALEDRPDLAACETREELRAEAFGWLAHPEDVIALLNGTYRIDDADGAEPAAPEPTRLERPLVVLHAHISQAAVDARLDGCPDGVVARVEELGPVLLESFIALTGRADLTIKPVIDLNDGRSVNQYEHPPDVKERGLLRTTGDVFPHAQTQSRALDNDHPDPFDKNGPPGQTGDHNHAPLGRRHHRAKTHLGYRLFQLGFGRYLWRTPHGLWRVVDGSGTHTIDEETAHGYVERLEPQPE